METPEDIRRWIRSNSTRVEFKRKAALVNQGEVSKYVHLVESGCLRFWYNDDGRDVTLQFFQKGEAVGPFECMFWNKPSEFNLEAVVTSTVWMAKKDVVLPALQTSPKMNQLVIDTLLRRLATYQQTFLRTIKNNPQERFLELISSDPELWETVPQHYIASYLGITPVSLSRIRKKVLSS